METAIRIRKKRETPNKKWNVDEVEKILDYLQQSEEIEAPTAQIYYKKFLEKSGINATWELIRWKVRHLKSSFKRAEEWHKSTGVGLLEGDECTSVEVKLNIMCPHYKKLSEIFGAKNSDVAIQVLDTGEPDVDFLDASDITVSSPITNQFSELADLTATTSSPITKEASEFASKLKIHAPKSSITHLLQFQEERRIMLEKKFEWENGMLEKKLEWEKEKHSIEMEVAEKRLKLEEGKIKAEMEMNVLKIAKEEKLAIMALEKEERLATLELKLKYNAKD